MPIVGNDYTLPSNSVSPAVTGTTIDPTDFNAVLDDIETAIDTLAGAAPGSGDVSAAAVITDNRIVRGDGGAKGVQDSAITVDDSGNMSGVGTLTTSGVVTAGTTAATAVKLNPSGFVEFPEVAAPSTPASGFLRAYAKTDGKLYQLNDAGTETDLSQAGGGGSSGHGQCRLTKSSTNLLLSPYGGNLLIVNGTACTVPDAGVTLAPTSLSANTTYFIYATASGGVINALEASATGHSTDTASGNKGVEIKTGDSTRTLVGMARTNGSTAWVDSATQRYVLSWFNRRLTGTTNIFTANRTSTTGSTWTEINSEIRNELLVWANEAVWAGAAGAAALNLGTDGVWLGIGFDSATPEDGNNAFQGTGAVGPVGMSISKSGLSEGYHYVTLTAKQTTGSSGLLISSGSANQRCALSTVFMG